MTVQQQPKKALKHQVRDSLTDYFNTLNGTQPTNLYEFIIRQVEGPLLDETLRYCGGNQSRAAEVLGINRGTLRKKLQNHGLEGR